MKNIKPLYISIGLNLLLLIVVIALLWPKQEIPPVDLSEFTQQDLSKSLLVEQGMSTNKVLNTVGKPAIKEIAGSKEEWHYCRTGEQVDEYVVVTFNDGIVSNMSNYTVSWLDVVFKHTQTPTEAMVQIGGLGDCKLTAKWGTYSK